MSIVTRIQQWSFGLGLLLALGTFSPAALAEGGKAPARGRPAKAQPKAPAKPGKKAQKPPEPEATPENSAASAPIEDGSKAPEPESKPESKVRAAGTTATDAPAAKAPVKEKEGPEGVKTYQFGAIEVEGRQKSPQLIYFLRRVRAEFDAGALGHRSFLGELSDSRNDSAFR